MNCFHLFLRLFKEEEYNMIYRKEEEPIDLSQ